MGKHVLYKNKYYREIYLTKIRIIERCIKLSDEEKASLEYRIEPRNKAEDEIKDLQDKLQKITDQFIKDIDAAIEAKSKEIMTV